MYGTKSHVEVPSGPKPPPAVESGPKPLPVSIEQFRMVQGYDQKVIVIFLVTIAIDGYTVQIRNY
jgi:hypothetical protein